MGQCYHMFSLYEWPFGEITACSLYWLRMSYLVIMHHHQQETINMISQLTMSIHIAHSTNLLNDLPTVSLARYGPDMIPAPIVHADTNKLQQMGNGDFIQNPGQAVHLACLSTPHVGSDATGVPSPVLAPPYQLRGPGQPPHGQKFQKRYPWKSHGIGQR